MSLSSSTSLTLIVLPVSKSSSAFFNQTCSCRYFHFALSQAFLFSYLPFYLIYGITMMCGFQHNPIFFDFKFNSILVFEAQLFHDFFGKDKLKAIFYFSYNRHFHSLISDFVCKHSYKLQKLCYLLRKLLKCLIK